MKPLSIALAACGLLVLSGSAAAAEIPLQAGVARVEITPATLMAMYGYAKHKCGPLALSTHDRLHAKVLVLQTGDSRVAIVTLDLGALVSSKLRREVASKLGINNLLLAASHTHSGPLFPSQEQGGSEDSPYQAEIESKIFSAISEASKSMFPARLAIGRGSLQLGYNRLVVGENGRARAAFENPERIPYGPVNPEFILLAVEDLSGKTRALLVHYAVHAVTLGPSNCEYSADYPGVLQARVEAAMPGAQCMFVQGGAGDINPLFLARSGKATEDFAMVDKMGGLLAVKVLQSARDMKQIGPLQYPIQTSTEILKFSNRWDKSKSIDVGITTILINHEIAIAALPGEPFSKLQTFWKAQAGVPYPIFYGYTYSSGGVWPGYIPDLRSAALGGYGADVSTSIEVGAGEAIMQHSLINLYGMLGMLREKPGLP